jgi:hypothetical protein
MEKTHRTSGNEPRFETSHLPIHLRPVEAQGRDDDDDVSVGHDSGSQAWGDYLAEMEGLEI